MGRTYRRLRAHSPSAVGLVPLRPRSSRVTPSRRSSAWIRFVAADWVRFSASAAPCTLPVSIAAAKAASSRAESGSAIGIFQQGMQAGGNLRPRRA